MSTTSLQQCFYNHSGYSYPIEAKITLMKSHHHGGDVDQQHLEYTDSRVVDSYGMGMLTLDTVSNSSSSSSSSSSNNNNKENGMGSPASRRSSNSSRYSSNTTSTTSSPTSKESRGNRRRRRSSTIDLYIDKGLVDGYDKQGIQESLCQCYHCTPVNSSETAMGDREDHHDDENITTNTSSTHGDSVRDSISINTPCKRHHHRRSSVCIKFKKIDDNDNDSDNEYIEARDWARNEVKLNFNDPFMQK